MPYTVTNQFENVTTFSDLIALPNQSTGYFWLGMLVMIFAVLSMTFLSYGFEVAIITSAFISLILGMLLVYMGLLTWQWLMMFLGIILFLMFYITWNNKRERR